MTISVLVLFILMLAELVIFITLSTGYSSLSQAYSQQSNVLTYRSYLASTSKVFASEAVREALFSLAYYEESLNAGAITDYARETDLITNSSEYIAYIIKNASVPNADIFLTYNGYGPGINEYTYGVIGDYFVLSYFNDSVEAAPPFGASGIIINESMPQVYQSSPYNLSVKYTEYISFNMSGTRYKFVIPVNATASLNGTPDLYYAQRGVQRLINFANVSSLVNNVGNAEALNGTTSLFSYGSVLDYGSNTLCPSNNGLITSQIIFATSDAQNINCNGSVFGGIISYNSPSATPANYVAYLNYPVSSNYISNAINTGQSVLLYGPSLSTLSTQGLISAINNGYYFASPFAPSYLDRADGNMGNSSVDGIFTLAGYPDTAAYLTDNSYITGNRVNVANLTNLEWVYPMSNQSFGPIAGFDGSTRNYGFYNISLDNGNIVIWNGARKYVSSFIVPTYKWSLIGFSLNKSSIRVFDNGNSQLFSSLSNPAPNPQNNNFIIGAQLTGSNYYTDMAIANLQLYGRTLSTQQAYKVYQNGIGSLPITNENITLWLPLTNNTNDYSGAGYYGYVIWSGSSGHGYNIEGHNNITSSRVSYAYLQNYNRDSALIVPSAQPTFPIPGILSCSNNQQCANLTSPHLYLADMPLEYGPRLAASFNPSVSSMIVTQQLNGTPLTKSNSFTFSTWIYGYGPATPGETIANSSSNNNNAGFDLLSSKLGSGQSDYVLSIAPCCNNRVQWPNGMDSLPLDTWEMVTAEYNTTTGIANVYLNATLFASKNVGKGLTAGQLLPIYLGSNSVNGGPSYSFNGLMSDAQLYNNSLSQNQISLLYSEGTGGSPLSLSSLVAWWPLNGNANDYSGNGNNGFAYNLTYAPFTGYSESATSTPTAISDEWQALGFGAAPQQSIFWNVTEWTSSSGIIPYSSVTASPALPQGVTVDASNIAGWYGIPTDRNNANGLPGFTGWAYESNTIANRQIDLMNAVPFPVPFNGLNSAIACGSGTGYTATANLTLTGTYAVNVYTTGAIQAFYTQVGSGIWNPILPSAAWGSNNGQAYSGSFTLTPGAYQFAVDYEESCGTGTSAFSMSYG